MPFSIKFTPESQADIQEAFDWYELQSTGLGDRFLSFVDEAVNRLTITPGIGLLRFDDVHCTMLKKFPYFIYYIVDEFSQLITVLRIFHSSRKPIWEK